LRLLSFWGVPKSPLNASQNWLRKQKNKQTKSKQANKRNNEDSPKKKSLVVTSFNEIRGSKELRTPEAFRESVARKP